MPDIREDYTAEEEQAIFELRERMKNELPPEIYEDKVEIYKFLKARNFNLKKSEIMLRNNLRFRKEIQTDTLMDYKSCEVLHKYIAQSFLGFDKAGCPLRYIAIGNIDGIGVFKSVNAHHLIKHALKYIEIDKQVQKQQSKKLGRAICQSVHIYDLDKFSFTQATHKQSIIQFMKGVVIFQDNYPETLKKIYVINAAAYFTMAWPLVKPFLAPALLEKIQFFGESGWKEELIKSIDPEVLPAFLGGRRTDPDGNPLCLTFVKHGGKVPESYYLVKDFEKSARKPGMRCIKLERQATKSIPIKVQKPMSFLNWEFETKCYDIGFGLMVQALGEQNVEEIIPIHKQDTENEPHHGMYQCKKAGEYTIVFDNSYSWLHSKEVCYRTWVADSDDIE